MATILYKPIAQLTLIEHEQISEIVRPYYTDATELLKRALSHNNYIYLSYVDSVLAAFFMVAWEALPINGVDHPSLFLGLGCADPAFRNRKLVSAMYKQSVLDAADWQASRGQELIIWFTTATPVVWHIMNKVYRLAQPACVTDWLPGQVAVAHAIRQYHYPHAQPSMNPFVLKVVATGTQYAPAERTYLNQASQNGPTVFDQLDINEAVGDRLLVLCSLPSTDVLERHKELLESYVREGVMSV